MKLLFFGGDFGIPTLKILLSSWHDILAVFLPPAKPGFSNRLKAIPEKLLFACYRYIKGPDPYDAVRINSIKEQLILKDIPIYCPTDIKDPNFINMIYDIKPDLIISAGYTKIFQKSIINIPQYGCINLHPSLLPCYRGPSPVFWQIANGEQLTGVTVHYIDEGVDTGNILYQEETPLGKDETTGELFLRLARLGADAVLKSIDMIESGYTFGQRQDHAKASCYPRMRRENVEFCWKDSADQLRNLIRAGSPWPGAYCRVRNKELIIWKADSIIGTPIVASPGIVIGLRNECIDVSTGCGFLRIKDASVGMRQMPIGNIIRKLRLEVGSYLLHGDIS